MLIYDKETGAMSIVAKDTGSFGFMLNNYQLDEGDVVYFTVNTELENEDPKIQKIVNSFQDHKALIQLSSADTDIPVGKYYYDIQVNTADGRVDTIVGPYKFKVLGGVTY